MEAKRKPLEFAEARELVLETARALTRRPVIEEVRLADAHGRVLAAAARADRDYPALARSLRDGFAVRSADTPGSLRVIGEVRAGEGEQAPLKPGEALEIMTGAPVPDGADAVVMVETVKRSGSLVVIDQAAEPGQFINPRGAESVQNDTLIPVGIRLDTSHGAALAMAGYANVQVFRRPSVAILSTGDEIVDVETVPEPHQIRNSNSYMLAALVASAGGVPALLPVAPDTSGALRPLLERGLAHDMLLVSGGVSAGKYDLVKPGLRELGAEFVFERVRIQPGQPTAFGVANGRPVFGLPGNPGSSLVTFELFAKAAIAVLSGETEPILPLLDATFAAPFRHKGGLTRFLPASLGPDGRSLRHIPWQGSSDIPALARANVFLIADHDRESWATGDTIRVMRRP